MLFFPPEVLERERGEGWGRWVKGRKWGWKETAWSNGHTMQCADDILLSCTLETCMVL